jgi:outer membrane protein assembly factor BamB
MTGWTTRHLVMIGLFAVSQARADAQRGAPPPPRSTPPAEVARRPIREILAITGPDVSIGVEDEDGPYLFGEFTGIVLGGDGTLYVNDYSQANLRAFDARGKHLRTFGRRGRGPGEFSNPLILLHDGDSTLYAVQGMYGITELTAKADRMSYRRTFGVGTKWSSLCLLGDSLLAAGWVGERVMHVLDRDGKPIRSFGEAWNTDTSKVLRDWANGMDAGELTCDGAAGRIYLMSRAGGVARAYDVGGTLLWQVTLPDFRYSWHTRQSDGSLAVIYGEDVSSVLMPIEGERLLLQVSRRSFNTGSRPNRNPGVRVTLPELGVTSYVLDARSGRILSKSVDAPWLGRLYGNHAWLVETDPYPRARRVSVRFRRP